MKTVQNRIFGERLATSKKAGVQSKKTYGVRELLNYATVDDKVTAMKCQRGIPVQDKQPLSAPTSYPLPPDGGTRYEGPYNKMADVLKPPMGTDFQQVRAELMETSYDSHWKKPLSKSSYQLATVPKGFDRMATTLGMPSHKDVSVAELVNPPKRAGEVLFENSIGHELYVKSHKDYNPGEKVTRSYLSKGYDSTSKFGVRTPSDRRGIQVPKCVTWSNNAPFSVVSSKQMGIILHRPQVGKTLVREDVLGNKVPENFTFGARAPVSHVGVRELVHFGGIPSKELKDELEYVAHVNKIRARLHKDRFLSWKDLTSSLRHCDKKKRGLLPLHQVYTICFMYSLIFERQPLELLMRRFAILFNEDCVVYERFLKLINPNYEFPSFTDKIDGVLAVNLHYCTTHGESFKPPYWQECPPAGVPSVRNDLKYPQALINALKESLGDETDVPALISPSLMTIHGLSHRDLFVPRSLQQLLRIFRNSNVQIPERAARRIYDTGLQFDKTGGVCIETFKSMLEMICSIKLSQT